MNELRINIQINKKIFEYLFKNISSIYRDAKIDDDLFFYDNLTLLSTILGETENCVKPRNYFACNGQGKIIFESENEKSIKVGYCMIFILNFFINYNDINSGETNICNLIKIKLIKENIEIFFNYKDFSLMIKDKVLGKLSNKEWTNLIIL